MTFRSYARFAIYALGSYPAYVFSATLISTANTLNNVLGVLILSVYLYILYKKAVYPMVEEIETKRLLEKHEREFNEEFKKLK